MTHHLDTDIAILGGGIAGLWLLRRLSELGYSTLLLENATLGGGQSIKSQGIIHGGTKYALSGNLTHASECIAGMPKRWQACLQGEGEIDLSCARILSPHHYMWSSAGLGSKLTTFFASKALRGRVDQLKPKNYPAFFQHPAFRGSLYQLNEFVLDVPSVVSSLVQGLEDRTLSIDWEKSRIEHDTDGKISAILLEHQGEQTMIRARRYLFTAGAGTADLLQRWGVEGPAMQLRPLHMAMVRVPGAQPLFAHCIGTSTVPRLTITSHPDQQGNWIWYIGGEPAESGVKREPSEQIARCQQELTQLMPWIDFTSAEWGTLRVDRAEPRQSNLLRPDAAYCKALHNALINWPTKLALAPNLSDEVLRQLQLQGIAPQIPQPAATSLPRPPVGKPFWEGVLP
ncbi:NAD(P)/FAD-dependent oxidoreductase [Aestuariirhabdus litorea]|uniref:FAD-dependent oxidoreductase n=1 Tax=Aestuariirhabdus litorea TaxID=2528527 RepID=A0A3P3VHZ7_9GAMM|nr:FAD-dependent oxidoreductase [Aestuariirhabdus litorea]RRJ82341.1 FAD-dependent oxidoreductase [Aestuariirhabdus litorea]RWW92506.1 FAD-dependent oxidoreductase [Endozoicomonadaceae bacterium GTF-13]